MIKPLYVIEVADDKTHRVFDTDDKWEVECGTGKLEGLTCEQAVRAKYLFEAAFSKGFHKAKRMAIEELMRLGSKQ